MDGVEVRYVSEQEVRADLLRQLTELRVTPAEVVAGAWDCGCCGDWSGGVQALWFMYGDVIRELAETPYRFVMVADER
jgi:hypothetical protein